MTVQTISGMSGMIVPDWRGDANIGLFFPGLIDYTLDAAGELLYMSGYAWLPGRVGSSKTISSAGGKIHFMVGAATITFSDPGTTLRVGIQDLTATGPPMVGDTTFDVYDDMVGGTDTLTANAVKTVTMSNGTKTIAHGDKIAIAFDMSARAGTDSMKVRCLQGAGTSVVGRQFPSVTHLGSNQSSIPIVCIEFDDGTFGFIDGTWWASTAAATLYNTHTYNSGSTPDEYAIIFQVPFKCSIDALTAFMLFANSSSDLEIILYSDPEGTPSVVEAITLDANYQGVANAARVIIAPLTTIRTLEANTKYAIAIRPTSANNVNAYSWDVGAAGQMVAHPLGTNAYYGTRTNQTGAFSTTTTRRLMAGARLCALSDDASSGGGGQRVFGGG